MPDAGPSVKIKKAREKNIPKTCLQCTEGFMAAHPNAKYCSDKCLKAAREAK